MLCTFGSAHMYVINSNLWALLEIQSAQVGLDTNISTKALSFFLETLTKIPKFLQNLL